MPFTVSHIAAVLPWHKRLSRFGLLSAAAIGAMSPDLGLILPVGLPREQTHGLLALLTFCLPAGLAVWALFQALIKPALLEVLPDRIYIRLCTEHLGPRLGNLKAWLYAALAILLGALTHLVWDGFTHEDGRGTRMLLQLEELDPEQGGSQWHMHQWLQHGSSAVGLAVVFMALWLWVRHTGRPDRLLERRLPARERHRWLGVCILIPILLIGAAAAQIQHHGWPRLYSTAALTQLAVTGANGAALGLVFTSALIRRRVLILGAGRSQLDT